MLVQDDNRKNLKYYYILSFHFFKAMKKLNCTAAKIAVMNKDARND